MFKTKRLILDELSTRDALALFNIATRINESARNDENYQPYYAFQLNEGERLHDKIVNFILKTKKEQTESPRKTYRYAIRKDGTLIGSIAIDMKPTIENGQVILGDLGYFIDPLYGNQNYAHEACVAVLHQFFAQYEELDITAHPKNTYSIRLIEKLGGEKTEYIEKSNYSNEPRQKFIISRSNFIKKLYYRPMLTGGKEHV